MLLNVLEAGSGPPVALLHGLFGRAQNFGSLARRLAASFRVLSLDLRNHGASPHGPGMAYQALAADVMETLAARGALPACVLGHSMGGKAAMVMALLHQDAVDGLVVADIAPLPYAHANGRIARAMLALELVPGVSRADASRALEAAVPDEAVRGFLLQNFDSGAAPAWRIGLAEIEAGMAEIEGWPELPATVVYEKPTLFLAGSRSDYVRPDSRQAILARFPAASFETLEAGHWLHAEQPAAFGSAVVDFLEKRVWGRSPPAGPILEASGPSPRLPSSL
jgi:pimeloyl-ACP methyl ester carboxylesterase